MFHYLVIFIFVLWIILFRYKRRRLYRLALKFPSSGEIPFFGIAHNFIGDTEHIMSTLINFSEKCIKSGGILRGWFCHILYIMVINPVDLEKVLRTCPEKDGAYKFARKLTGSGILFAPAAIWRRRRKIMIPVLSQKVVERFFNGITNQSNKLVTKLIPKCGSGQFDVMPFVSRYTFDSICEAALGVKLNTQDDPKVPVLSAFNRLTNLVMDRVFHLWLQPDWLFKLFRTKYIDQEKSYQTLQDFIDQITSNYKSCNENDAAESSGDDWNDNNLSDTQDKTFLDLLIKSSGGKNGYNGEELREELLSLILAATDTSAITICNILVLLKKYPKVQEKVYDEIKNVLKDKPLEKENLAELIYLERVIKESLRLFPPGPFIARKVLNETKLPSGYILPANTGILISIWGMHRHPDYWGPDAECFDPDRFLPERLNLPYSCCYMPFSNGSRNCIGIHFAMMTVKVALATILRSYRVVGAPEDGPVPRMKIKFEVTMKLVDGWQVELESR